MNDSRPFFTFVNFAHRLKTALSERRLKPVDLARGAELSTAAVSNYLNEKNEPPRIPKAEELLRISRFLNVTMEELLTGEGARYLPDEPCTSRIMEDTPPYGNWQMRAEDAERKLAEVRAVLQETLTKILG